MALLSNLFKGDKNLEACQVNDAAHLTLGAKGDHVAKVQLALYALDSLVISPHELRSHTYGPSTAEAVLRFKTKRRIINFAYQRTPDDIVGKMTISRLDQDLHLWELTHRPKGDCSNATAGAPHRVAPFSPHGSVSTLVAAQPVADVKAKHSTAGKLPQLGKWLRIYCSITKKAFMEDGYPIAEQIQNAKDRLFDYGLILSVEIKSGFADIINFPGSLVLDEDVALLRKASEDTRRGLPTILRVIVAPRSPNANTGQTFRHISIGGLQFPPFVVLNSKTVSDGMTMLHEMIHAAHNGPVAHDPEPESVFHKDFSSALGSIARTWLKPEHAITLSKSFFALG
jgi:hypothetical protein